MVNELIQKLDDEFEISIQTENSIKELQKIQGVNENYNSLDDIYSNSIAAKNLNNVSQKDFEKLSFYDSLHLHCEEIVQVACSS